MTEREQLEHAIATLETQRSSLGNAAVDATLAGLREKLAALQRAEETSQPHPAAFAGERKLVTIMFADLSGFTALSERMDPEAVRELMNDCFDRLVPVVEKYDGTVDKFIGDEIMALFGAPVTHENDAEQALVTALEMMEVLKAFNAERNIHLGMHIGINTGLVIAGGMGSSGRQQYSVIGDAVNLASRLEDTSEREEILVGPDTYRLVSSLFDFDAKSIRVKGKAEAVKVYNLRGKKKKPGPRRDIEGLYSPLVGRDTTLRQLGEALSALRDGQGGLMAITGDAGLGKSRLVAEIRQAQGEGLTWVEGRALSYGQEMSYWVIRDLLRSQLDVRFEARPEEAEDVLRSSLARRLPEQVEAVYPFLAHLLELPLDEGMAAQVQRLSSPALQEQLGSAVADYVRALSQERPVVLVGEDLHWTDPSSLHLFEALLPLVDEAPVFLLLVFRPEGERILTFHQHLRDTRGEGYQVLVLTPLTREESAQLVQNLLRIENLPEETGQQILDKTEGNPFFVEEVLRSLVDAGLVVLEGERATVSQPIESIDVPDTLQGVIAARIDRLSPEDKHTLQVASVIGRVFQHRVLVYLAAQKPSGVPLDPSLRELRRRELIRLRRMAMVEVEPEYTFKHMVTWEVTYNSLLLAQRRDLHQAAGQAIEALFPDQRDQLSPTLAYHFYQAADFTCALPYLIKAAQRAQETYAYDEGRRFLGQAQEAIAQLEEAAVRPQRWEVLLTLAAIEDRQGNGDRVLPLCQEVLERAHPEEDQEFVGRALMQIGWVQYRKADWEEALRLHQEAMDLFAALGDEQRCATIHLCVGNIAFERSQLDEAERHYKEAQDAATKNADYSQLGSIYGNLGVIATVRGQYVEAMLHYTESLKAYGRVNHRYGLCQTYHNLGMAHAAQQEWQAALQCYTEAEKQAQEIGILDALANILISRAVTHIGTNRLEEAEQACRQARAHMEQMGDRLGLAECSKVEGMICRERSQYPEAEEHLQQGRRLFAELENQLGVAECDLELGLLEQQRGDVEEARRYLQESRRRFQETGADEDARKAEDLLSALIR